jgi:predicted ATP-grasp superfamily ATP-dependent carboligase
LKTAKPFRALITDSNYKHAIALTRYLKRELPEVYTIGHVDSRTNMGSWYSCYDEIIRGASLAESLNTCEFDIVIPVGGRSVLQVAQTCPQKSVLPSQSSLATSYDKAATVELAARAGVPTPKTRLIRSLAELNLEEFTVPCVVKPAHEAVAKMVGYCRTTAEVQSTVQRQLQALQADGIGVLVQEYIPGGGYGFFALMNEGTPVRIFMHQRIREFPVSGGASTAARAFDSPRLRELGLKLLTELCWTGVAMVEFKLDSRSGDFVLMEINGKFWGSLELALRAGVNFGADIVRLFRGERLVYSDSYDRNLHFYWPLDNDLLTLWKMHSLGRALRDYWQPHAATNCGQSVRADFWKTVRLAKSLVMA